MRACPPKVSGYQSAIAAVGKAIDADNVFGSVRVVSELRRLSLSGGLPPLAVCLAWHAFTPLQFDCWLDRDMLDAERPWQLIVAWPGLVNLVLQLAFDSLDLCFFLRTACFLRSTS